MKTFLQHVAEDLCQRFNFNFDDVALVFPNKRAALFMSDCLAQIAQRPIWSPAYITISELFRQHSTLVVPDQIKLICDLHRSFTRCTGLDDSLDNFFAWGQLMLADFDDIDKNLARPEQVFSNLNDIHQFDNTDFLSSEQKKALQLFFQNFSPERQTELKRRFASLWQHFLDIYNDFNERLAAQNLAYEGALYRSVATTTDIPFRHRTYVFIGFNMLHEVEQLIFKRLKQQGRALFYWDFDKFYMQNPANEAAHYIRQYKLRFPNALNDDDGNIYDNLSQPKEITYIAATTEDIQARYVSTWLRENNRLQDGRRTAIVLCDERLLQSVVHQLPPETEAVNITTGFPLDATPLASAIPLLIQLQTNGLRNGKFRLRNVLAVLRHPITKYISTKLTDALAYVNEQRKFAFDPSELALDEALATLFSPQEAADQHLTNLAITQWMISVLDIIARNCRDEEPTPLFAETLFRLRTLLNRIVELISCGDLHVNIITYTRLLQQIIAATTIPFHGEPAEGIQVMGVLETRNLDFQHLLILSCNNGNIPKGINDASFIPHIIRKANQLTTVDNKVAIYSYYFQRLLQRASDITIAYNCSVSDGQKGEMSPFMLQMLVESKHKIRRLTLQAGQTPDGTDAHEITKSPDIVAKLNKILENSISPSALNRYLRCQLRFFYNDIAGIKELNEIEDDDIDNRMFGNIFHRAAQYIYEQLTQRQSLITSSSIETILNHRDIIASCVDRAFQKEMGSLMRATPNGMQIINRTVIIDYLFRLLKIDQAQTPFSIIALEGDFYRKFSFSLNNHEQLIKIGGIIDRLEIKNLPDGTQRIKVVDYKTGRPSKSAINNTEEIFTTENIGSKHKDYFLQTMLYADIIATKVAERDQKLVPFLAKSNPTQVAPALLFIQSATKDDDSSLVIAKQPIHDISVFTTEFEEQLSNLLTEVFNPDIPFKPTADNNNCISCPYKKLCNR